MTSEPLPATAASDAGGQAADDEDPGDRIARLVRRHQRALFAYLSSMGCPDAQVEDLAQETFVAALCNGIVEAGEAAARAWLRTVARNRYLDHLRRDRRTAGVDLDALDAAWVRFDGDDGGAGYLEALRLCLARLPERERRALELRYSDGLDRARVADALGLSLGGIKSLLAKTKATLRACIERRLP